MAAFSPPPLLQEGVDKTPNRWILAGASRELAAAASNLVVLGVAFWVRDECPPWPLKQAQRVSAGPDAWTPSPAQAGNLKNTLQQAKIQIRLESGLLFAHCGNGSL